MLWAVFSRVSRWFLALIRPMVARVVTRLKSYTFQITFCFLTKYRCYKIMLWSIQCGDCTCYRDGCARARCGRHYSVLVFAIQMESTFTFKMMHAVA